MITLTFIGSSLLLETTGTGTRLLGHFAAGNPVLRLTGWAEARALAVFLGPYDYLSPDDYVTGGGLPTSNYVAVHAWTLDQAPAEIRALRQRPTGASWDLATLMAITHRHDDARDVGQLDRDRFGGHAG